MELLVEACHTALPVEPYRAFLLSQLAVELGRLLAAQSVDPEVEVLCRALCLGGHACRLLGDHGGAEDLLEKGGFLARDLAARGFSCRALSLLRWDQGRIEEAAALLHQAGRRYEGVGDTGEEAACLALLGLLYTEEEELDLAEPLLRKARLGLVGKLRPWLTAQTHLALALCLARSDQPVEARRLRESARALSSGVPDEQALFSLLWREAQVAEVLGDLTAAGQLFDSVRLKLIEELFSVFLESLDTQAVPIEKQWVQVVQSFLSRTLTRLEERGLPIPPDLFPLEPKEPVVLVLSATARDIVLAQAPKVEE